MSNDMSCPSARDLIAAYGGDSRLRRFIEPHVLACSRCTAIVDALEKLTSAFVDGGDVHQEIARVIDARLASQRPHRWEWMARDEPEFHHRVVIAHLLERSDECYPSKPADGLSYADAAIGAFEAMNACQPPANASDALLYASALKNRATYLYLLCRYSHALCAADASANVVAGFRDAEEVIAHCGAVSLARCMIYGDVDVCEYDKALLEVANAEALFVEACPQRVSDARWHRAMIQARSGRLQEARRSFQELLATTQVDSARGGSLLQCLAWCALLEGDDESTLAYASRALEIHTDHNDRGERAKAEWAIGRVLSRRGDHDAARAKFDSASAVFTGSDQQDLWIRVRLDYINDLLSENAAADVRMMCESIAVVSHSLDQREPLRRHHCTAEASSYLRNSAAASALTAGDVGYVIKYLDQLM